MGFFKKKRKDVTVSIGSVTREYVEEPTYRELDQIIGRHAVKTLYAMLPDVKAYYPLKMVNGSRINGYIREKKIKKQKNKADDILYDYYPFFIDGGLVEIGDDRSVTFTTAKGTKRTIGQIAYKDFEKFEDDFTKYKLGIYVTGGPCEYAPDPTLDIGGWCVYVVFVGNKES
ncbi:MAG TPA: hypothetical protein DCQ45_06615 [Erysipelotrichaceae bacterium]|nr:hypothetical protein [Erysipelotrichaceae bacterium]